MTTPLTVSRRTFILASAAALASSRVHGQATPEATPTTLDDLSWSSIVDGLPPVGNFAFSHLTLAPSATVSDLAMQGHAAFMVLDGEVTLTTEDSLVLRSGEGSTTEPAFTMALENGPDSAAHALLLQVHPTDAEPSIATPTPLPASPGVEARLIASLNAPVESPRAIMLVEQDVRRRNAPFVTSTNLNGVEMGEIVSGSADVVSMYGVHIIGRAGDPDFDTVLEHAERVTLAAGDRYISFDTTHNWRVGSDERLVTWRAQVIPIPQP